MNELHWKWNEQEEDRMEVTRRGDVVYLHYPAFDKTGLVKHGFSTRLGGVSTGIWSSMNLSYTRGDDPEAVTENFRRITEALKLPLASLVTSDQTHTTNVRRVGAKAKGSGILRARDYQDVDGMITDVPGVTLTTFYADCVPLYFLDPVHKAIGLSHSGWRGTVGKMGKVTVEAMKREFNSRPEDILAAIGPSICQDCYEVSEDVIVQFREAFAEELWPSLFYGKGRGKYQLDLKKANQAVLLETGVSAEHISLPGLCTCCNHELLFSHRASQGKRGNLAAFLMLCE